MLQMFSKSSVSCYPGNPPLVPCFPFPPGSYPPPISFHLTKARVVHIMLNVSDYYANSLCSTNVTILLQQHHYYAPLQLAEK